MRKATNIPELELFYTEKWAKINPSQVLLLFFLDIIKCFHNVNYVELVSDWECKQAKLYTEQETQECYFQIYC